VKINHLFILTFCLLPFYFYLSPVSVRCYLSASAPARVAGRIFLMGLKIMHSYRSLAASLIAALALVAACNPRDTSTPASNATAQNNAARAATKPATTPETAATADDVRRITREELQAGLEKGSVALFDVRDKVSYEAGHIKGAKLVPWSEVETRLDEFPKDKQIVTYCA
jgi:hypothetical protein